MLGLAWLYPVNQSVSYKPDRSMTEQYVADIRALKETYRAHTRQLEQKDMLAHDVHFFLLMYEQTWLINDRAVRVHTADIIEMASAVRDTRGMIIDLLDRAQFTPTAQDYLIVLLNETLSLEDDIETLQHHTSSRAALEHQLSSLHVEFVNHFSLFKAFYNAHIEKR